MKDELRAVEASAPPGSHLPSPAELRILLWDIDGTLIRSSRAGAFRDYTAPAIEGVFGTAGRLSELSVSGMTDLQIVAEALRDEGFTPAHVRERIDELRALFMREMERVTGESEALFYLLPGVREALTAARAHTRYRSALLTGNLEAAAHLKMRLVGLSRFFQLPGAFGDDSHDRRDLPALAHDRISRHLGFELQPSQLIVIGDTPNDIACARHFGARAVAVATGRFYQAADLLAHEPDALLPDLSDTALVMRTFDGL
jgi:phosphoglycolate phosphatase-like HAD superfamily hydrolase